MIAAADREAQPIECRTDRRRRPGTAGLAHFVAGSKPIPVVARRFEAGDLHVHAVSQLRPRDGGALARDRREHHVNAAAVGQAGVEAGAVVAQRAADELGHVARGAEQALFAEARVGLVDAALLFDPDVFRAVDHEEAD